jgi:hypothetical protein
MMSHSERAGLRLEQLTSELNTALASEDEEAVCRIAELLPKAVQNTLQRGVSGRLPSYDAIETAQASFDRAEEFLTRRMNHLSQNLGTINSGRAAQRAYRRAG